MKIIWFVGVGITTLLIVRGGMGCAQGAGLSDLLFRHLHSWQIIYFKGGVLTEFQTRGLSSPFPLARPLVIHVAEE